MQTRSWIFAWIAAAIAVGAGVAVYGRLSAPLELESGTVVPDPRPIGEFALLDQQGRPFGPEALENRWSLVFTGFTHCPDLCPTTLAFLASLRSQIPGRNLRIVFVSVDPERDTPEAIASYLAHFGPGFVGVTGASAEIERFTKALGVAQVRNPGVGGEYTVDHSAALVLIDPRVRVAGYFLPPHVERALAADLKRLSSY
jgi:protein SCO1/2